MGALLLVPFTPAEALALSPHVQAGIDTSTCAACHSAHTATAQPLLRHVSADGTAANVCFVCHNGTNADAANVVTGTPDSFALASGHSLTEPTPGTAKIEGCATCHFTHGAIEQDGRMLPAKTINGVAVTSAGPQLCLACHTNSDDWFGPGYPKTSEPARNAAGYPVSGTWPGTTTYTSSTNGHRLLPETTITVGAGAAQPREQGDCRYCHASHRGANTYDSLLSTFTVPTDATLAADKTDGAYADLCFKCHGGVKPSGFDAAPVNIQLFATSGGVDCRTLDRHFRRAAARRLAAAVLRVPQPARLRAGQRRIHLGRARGLPRNLDRRRCPHLLLHLSHHGGLHARRLG